jgi:hypothetical protein
MAVITLIITQTAKKRKVEIMFNFRIITCPDGTQVIDHSLKTPYSSLTPVQMQEYMEIDTQIAFMERLKRKSKRKSDRKRKLERNPFYKTACMFGLV